MSESNKYIGATITNIRRGSGLRRMYIYAFLYAADGELLMAATLDDCVEAMKERLPSRMTLVESDSIFRF